MEIDDWLLLLGGWIITLQLTGLFMGPRLRLVVATFISGMAFLVYRRAKDRLPRQFFRHLLGYVVEADTYRVTPDDRNIPYVVELGLPEEDHDKAAGRRSIAGA